MSNEGKSQELIKAEEACLKVIKNELAKDFFYLCAEDAVNPECTYYLLPLVWPGIEETLLPELSNLQYLLGQSHDIYQELGELSFEDDENITCIGIDYIYDIEDDRPLDEHTLIRLLSEYRNFLKNHHLCDDDTEYIKVDIQ